MYCGKCGKEMERSAKFCPHCGAENPNTQTADARPGEAAAARAAKPKLSSRTVGIAAVAVIVVAVLVLFVSLSGSRSAEEAAEQFVDAITTADSAQLIDLLPSGLTVENKAQVSAQLEEQLEDMVRYYGDPIKVTCQVASSEKTADSKLESIQKKYSEKYGITVKEAQVAYVKMSVSGSRSSDPSTTSFSLPLVKVGDSWAVDYLTMVSGNYSAVNFLK